MNYSRNSSDSVDVDAARQGAARAIVRIFSPYSVDYNGKEVVSADPHNDALQARVTVGSNDSSDIRHLEVTEIPKQSGRTVSPADNVQYYVMPALNGFHQALRDMYTQAKATVPTLGGLTNEQATEAIRRLDILINPPNT